MRDLQSSDLEITKEEKAVLWEQVVAGRAARRVISAEQDHLEVDERARLDWAVVAGQQAKQRLVLADFPFVYSCAARLKRNGQVPAGVPFVQLLSIGLERLLAAAETYEPERGISFLGYAGEAFVFQMRDQAREITRLVRVPRTLFSAAMRLYAQVENRWRESGCYPGEEELEAIAAGLGITPKRLALCRRVWQLNRPVSLDGKLWRDADEDDNTLGDQIPAKDDFLPDLINRELRETVERLLAEVDLLPATVFRLYYFESWALEDIGTRFGYTREWARLQRNKATKALTSGKNRRILNEFR